MCLHDNFYDDNWDVSDVLSESDFIDFYEYLTFDHEDEGIGFYSFNEDMLLEATRNDIISSMNKIKPGKPIDIVQTMTGKSEEDKLQKRAYAAMKADSAKGDKVMIPVGVYKKDSKYGKKGDIKYQELKVPKSVNKCGVWLSRWIETGDLILMYEFGENGKYYKTYIKYSNLARAIKFPEGKKIENKNFESLLNKAFDGDVKGKVDVFVNCECDDFLFRLMEPAQKNSYYYDPIKDKHPIHGGSNKEKLEKRRKDREEEAKKAGKVIKKQENPEAPYSTGVCKHIYYAFSDKRRYLRTKTVVMGQQDGLLKSLNINLKVKNLYSILFDATREAINKKLGVFGDERYQKLEFSIPTNIKPKKESINFADIIESAKQYLNSEYIQVISSETIENIYDSMEIYDYMDVDSYRLTEGSYNDVDIIVVETCNNVYGLVDSGNSDYLFE